MFFVLTLAITGLFLIFLEFFLPGVIMALGGVLLLFASLFVLHMENPSIVFFLCYLIGLIVLVYCVIQLAVWRVRATEKRGTIYLAADQQGFFASSYSKEMVGKIGKAETDLRPSGYVLIEKQSFQAVAKAGYIDKESSVEIIGGEGSHLIVKFLEVHL